jgi:hypothetical protein
MKASQHTAEDIIKILEQAEKGDQTIGAVCRTHGITEWFSRRDRSDSARPQGQS